MGNLMSCVLICGAVEVVQVVHSDGHVEKLIRPLEMQQSKKQQLKRGNSSMQEDITTGSISSISSNCLFEDNSKMPLEAEPLSGHSYLLLPINNVGESRGIYKYKRLSSFQFYKSAFSSSSSSSRSGDCGSRNNNNDTISSSSSSSSAGAKGSSRKSHNKKPHDKNVDDQRKQLLNSQVPFRVKQEGGVTKLVVSKKYLAQLLSESNMKKSSSSSSSSSKEVISGRERKGSSLRTPSTGAQALPSSPIPCTKPSSQSAAPRVGRPSVWRPALESISEAHIR